MSEDQIETRGIEESLALRVVRDLSGDDEAMRIAKSAMIEELVKPGGPTDFSIDGAKELIQQNGEYVRELGLEAIKLARKARLDTVSATHVRVAADGLRAQPNSVVRTGALTCGGLAGGAGLQELVRLLNTTAAIVKEEMLITIALLVIGTALLVIGLVPRGRR